MADLTDGDLLRLIHDRVADLKKMVEIQAAKIDDLVAAVNEKAIQDLEVDEDGRAIPPSAFIEKDQETGLRSIARVPSGAPPAFCRDCNARIYWVRNARFPNNDRGGPNLVMFNGDGTCHMDTCKVKAQARATPQGDAAPPAPRPAPPQPTEWDTSVPF